MPDTASRPRSQFSTFLRLGTHAVGLSCAILCFLASSVAGTDDMSTPLDPETFLANYREVLDRLDVQYRNVRIEGLSVPERNTQFVYVSSNGSESLSLKRAGPEYFDRVFVSAGTRRFRVLRPTPDGSYYLENSVETDDDFAVLKHYRFGVRQWFAFLPPEDVRSPNSRIVEVSRITDPDSGRKLVHAGFESQRPSHVGGNSRMKGWFRIDPEFDQVLHSCDYEVRRRDPTPPEKEGRTGIGQPHSGPGWSIGERVARWSRARLNEASNHRIRWNLLRYIYKINGFSFQAAPPGDFSLAAFGLGDIEHTAAPGQLRIVLVVGHRPRRGPCEPGIILDREIHA